MSQEHIDLPQADVAAAIAVALDQAFYQSRREEAKRLYTELSDGKNTKFMRLQTNTGNIIDCNLTMDASQYDGKLNFSKFRKSLAMTLIALKQRLENKEDVNMLSNDVGDVLFNVPGIVKSGDIINVMVVGLRQTGHGKALVRLLYLDPQHYVNAARATRSDSA